MGAFSAITAKTLGHFGRLPVGQVGAFRWPYTVLGIGFAIIGVFCTAYVFRRREEVEDAVSHGQFARPDERVVALLSAAGIGLRALLIVVPFAES